MPDKLILRLTILLFLIVIIAYNCHAINKTLQNVTSSVSIQNTPPTVASVNFDDTDAGLYINPIPNSTQ